ncbi:MOSC domain-containing protein [Nocardioides panacisoli]|uniref:MOSC domain-containing protein n=1 Tax=Nocardioides panacisoli TaxID=627624 RepID=A0ABP7I3M4_9ACTN
MKVVGLWRYPVKSLQGEAVASATVERDGVAGDRTWGIRDESTGRILTARRRPPLLEAAAAYDDGMPVVTLPDGSVLRGPGRQTDAALSDWLAMPVSLVSSAGDEGRAEFFADATDDTSEAIEFTMPEGRYVDAAPLLVLTTASLRTGEGLHPEGDWSPRRFRPNLLVDADGDGWLEDDWVGQRVLAGEVELRPAEPCVRCTMVTRPQPGLEADVDVFRTLARHHRGRFGVWSDVVVPGTLTVGDEVRPS